MMIVSTRKKKSRDWDREHEGWIYIEGSQGRPLWDREINVICDLEEEGLKNCGSRSGLEEERLWEEEEIKNAICSQNTTGQIFITYIKLWLQEFIYFIGIKGNSLFIGWQGRGELVSVLGSAQIGLNPTAQWGSTFMFSSHWLGVS